MYEAWWYAFHWLKLDLKRKRSVYYWWKFRLTIAIRIDLIEFVTQVDYFCCKMLNSNQLKMFHTSWLIRSPFIDVYCPLIECSRYVVVRRCFDLCAFDRMHCLMRIEFCEGREIYYIAHTRKYSDSGEYFCVLPLLLQKIFADFPQRNESIS